ncbi:MAG: phage tail assembly protein [Desulfovibrio sp.]
MEPRTTTIKLRRPVLIMGKAQQELTLREETTGDLLDAYDMAEVDTGKTPSDPRVELYIIAACCGVPVQELMGMLHSDYINLVAARRFLLSGEEIPEAKADTAKSESRETGEKP